MEHDNFHPINKIDVGWYVTPKFCSGLVKLQHGNQYRVTKNYTDEDYNSCYILEVEDTLGNKIALNMLSSWFDVISKFETCIKYSDGDICLYGDRQVVIIGEPNKERQSAQIVDYPFAEDWQLQVEIRPLKELGMVLWNRFEEETKSPCNGLNGTEQAVHSPQHYDLFNGTEAIEVIASALTQAEFRGYCFGNLLKYRLRAGKKDDVVQELMKADKYKELYEKYKHLCKEG